MHTSRLKLFQLNSLHADYKFTPHFSIGCLQFGLGRTWARWWWIYLKFPRLVSFFFFSDLLIDLRINIPIHWIKKMSIDVLMRLKSISDADLFSAINKRLIFLNHILKIPPKKISNNPLR